MDHVYQLVAFCGEYDGQYEMLLTIDTDLQRVRAAKNELHAAVKQTDRMAEGWVGALAYERSVGCLRIQIEKVRLGVLGNENVEVIETEDWVSQEYLDQMARIMNND